MKSSYIIVFLFLLTYGSGLIAQPYYKLLKDGRNWVYTRMEYAEHPVYIVEAYALSIQGDTLLGGMTYKKVYQRTLKKNSNSTAIQYPKQILNTYLYALMREDTVGRKVYILPLMDTFYMCQSTEHLLYDFSLQEGDTLNDCVLKNIYEEWVPSVPIVDSIRLFNNSGIETRAFYTMGIFVNGGDLFYNIGLILEGFGYEVHGLINYGRIDNVAWFQYFCEGDSLDCELLSAVKEPPQFPTSVIKFSPNPASDILNVQIDPSYRKGTELKVSLVNPMGSIVLSKRWESPQALEVDVSSLQNGIYFLNIYGIGANSVQKIIVAH